MGIVCTADRSKRASQKKRLILNHYMDLLQTNQSLGLAPLGSAVQVRPTYPERLDAEIPEGR